jgi:hypothetical protein
LDFANIEHLASASLADGTVGWDLRVTGVPNGNHCMACMIGCNEDGDIDSGIDYLHIYANLDPGILADPDDDPPWNFEIVDSGAEFAFAQEK